MVAELTILAVNWNEYRTQLTALRHEVFILEQHVPVTEEIDEKDPTAQHFIVLAKNVTVGCARWIDLPDGSIKIGRFAVLKACRNKRIGQRLLQFILTQARLLRKNYVVLDAQVSAIGFYQKNQFTCCGDIFIDAGIPHKKMYLQLNTKP